MNNAPLLINGTRAPAFSSVRTEFECNFAERGEVGAAVSVYQDGKKAVDRRRVRVVRP
jgi:hypothetical protein